MNLYYVRWDNEDGMNKDALVMADSSVEAIVYWRAHFELDEGQEPYYAGRVPLARKPGVIAWEDIIPEDYEPEAT